MFLGLLIVMAITAYLGAPLAPVLMFGTLWQCGTAFVITRNPVCLKFIPGVLIIWVTPYLVKFIASQSHNLDGSFLITIADFLSKPFILYFVCALTLVVATLIGLTDFGYGFKRSSKPNNRYAS